MHKLEEAIKHIYELEAMALKRGKDRATGPLSRLFVCVFFIVVCLSFPKYDLLGVLSMVIYPLVISTVQEISFRKALHIFWPVLLLVAVIGIANPFFDRQVLFTVAGLRVTGGMVSFITLFIKELLALSAVYLLMATTGMEQICGSLRSIGVPGEVVTVIWLIYRYLVLLLNEVERMVAAYSLRAPGQKGLHIKLWGSFVGMLLLRSMDRANTVYESMQLRGYSAAGDLWRQERVPAKTTSILYAVGFGALFLFLRYVPLFTLVGSVFRF